MAVTLDAETPGGGFSGSTSRTISVAGGVSPSIAVLRIGVMIAAAMPTATYAGDAMTLVVFDSRAASEGGAFQQHAAIFIKVNPTGGTQDCVYSSSASAMYGNDWAGTFDGVDTGDPYGDTDSSGGSTGTTSTLTLTSATGNYVIDAIFAYQNGGGGLTTTQTQDFNAAGAGAFYNGGGAHAAGGASVAMEWGNIVTTITRSHAALDLKAAGAGGGGTGWGPLLAGYRNQTIIA